MFGNLGFFFCKRLTGFFSSPFSGFTLFPGFTGFSDQGRKADILRILQSFFSVTGDGFRSFDFVAEGGNAFQNSRILYRVGCLGCKRGASGVCSKCVAGQPSLFETVRGLSAQPLAFQLAEVRQLPSSGLWLHYVR